MVRRSCWQRIPSPSSAGIAFLTVRSPLVLVASGAADKRNHSLHRQDQQITIAFMFRTTRGNDGQINALVPLSLLMILLTTTALAAAVTWLKNRPTRNAAAILREIRTNGLSKYWQAKSEEWFLKQAGRRIVGWSVAMRIRREDGSFEGLLLHNDLSPTGGRNWEWWRLDDKATKGQYEAGQLLPDGRDWELLTDTRIHQANGVLTVEQFFEHRWLKSAAIVEPNYIPEGLGPLVNLLIAQKNIKARLRTILNDLPPYGNTSRITWITATGARAAEDAVAGAAFRVDVRLKAPSQDGMVLIEQSTFYDRNGRTLRRTSRSMLGGKTLGRRADVAATREQVLAVFPNAARVFKAISWRKGMLTNPDASPRTRNPFRDHLPPQLPMPPVAPGLIEAAVPERNEAPPTKTAISARVSDSLASSARPVG